MNIIFGSHLLKTQLLALALALLSAGCATPIVQPAEQQGTTGEPPKPDVPASPIDAKNLAVEVPFTLLGRLAVQTDKRGLSGSLHWQHDALRDHISLFSPLGSKVAEILSQPGLARLDTGEKSYTAESPEALTQQVLGWPLPVRHLTEWVRGAPNSRVAQIGQDEHGRSQGFDADGWQVRYLEYRMFSGQFLPSKLTMRSTDVYLKLVIDDWQPPAKAAPAPVVESPPPALITPK